MLNMGTSVITVRVGCEPNHTDFTVHENLIRASSEFFQAALGRPWRESQERIVRLPECDATVYKIYINWLYTGLLYAVPAGPSSSIGVSSSLVRGYLLGDYLQDADFRDNIIDALVEWNKDAETAQRTSFLSSWIGAADDQTCTGGPLQKLLVDMTVWDTSHAWWTSVIPKMPVSFVQDVCVGFSARCRIASIANPLRQQYKRCTYHSHGDKACYITEQTR
ncbi:uncharacterized protein J4E92_001427 [Alternaria infectoria]|uniref:uncharacterized protein n=1 Tax=Alternaria infectoria TaxID=45303 RepID=UPI002220120F|nr:uncharacterized protein J4E92_001427 [Alternaria infectoria]KAI4940139.1 hypothetical protein J4E92_001427 [Alternaria infectoria]